MPSLARRALANAVLVVVSVVFSALAAEALVRLVADDGMQFDLEMWKYARDVKVVADDPLMGHKHGPGRRARLMGVEFETNSKGLRDREFSRERTPGVKRIMMLGDLLTVGWGVPMEQTFSKRVEQLYRGRGESVEVINTGVGNYNTVQEVQFFLTEGKSYRPDIVVLNYFVNDAEPVPESRPPGWLLRKCSACVFALGRIDTLGRMFSAKQDWAEYYLGLYDNGAGKGWLAARAAIDRLATYCKANGIKLLVASLPELHDVQNYRFQTVTDLVRRAAEDNGVAFADVLPHLRAQASSKLWVTPPDPHPNGYANGFIASGLFEALQRL